MSWVPVSVEPHVVGAQSIEAHEDDVLDASLGCRANGLLGSWIALIRARERTNASYRESENQEPSRARPTHRIKLA